MPSHLRFLFDVQSTQSYFPSTVVKSPSEKKQKMSLTQTYRIAATARGKLGKEASRADHDLRLLVGHANLLDTLMVDLANAEREQEAWFNETVRSSAKAETPKHIQWMDSLAEEDLSDSDSESDSDVGADDFPVVDLPRRRSVSPPPAPTIYADDDFAIDDDMEYDMDEDEGYTLTRVPSHLESSMPDLVEEDSDSESEDDSMPPSPPAPTVEFDEKEQRELEARDLFHTLPKQLAQSTYHHHDHPHSIHLEQTHMVAAC